MNRLFISDPNHRRLMLLKGNAEINENPADLLKLVVSSLRHIFRKEDTCIK